MRSTITLTLVTLLLGAAGAVALDEPRHLSDAIRAQMRAVNARPGDSGVLNDLGNLLTLAGDLSAAEEAYRAALAMNPDDATARYNLALMLRLDGRWRAAVRELSRAVELDPLDAWGHYELGVLLEERRKTDRATHHYARAFVLDPSLTEFENNPQLLDSDLTTRAMMVAYEERVARFELAPRRYAQPKRITRLLVPESRATPSEPEPAVVESPVDSPEKKEPAPRKRRNRQGKPRDNDGGP